MHLEILVSVFGVLVVTSAVVAFKSYSTLAPAPDRSVSSGETNHVRGEKQLPALNLGEPVTSKE